VTWPTPQAHDATGARGKNNTFSDHHYEPHDLVTAVRWPTPRTRGMCGGTGAFQKMLGLQEAGVLTATERQQMTAGNGGQLNPAWVEILMGYPLGWTETP